MTRDLDPPGPGRPRPAREPSAESIASSGLFALGLTKSDLPWIDALRTITTTRAVVPHGPILAIPAFRRLNLPDRVTIPRNDNHRRRTIRERAVGRAQVWARGKNRVRRQLFPWREKVAVFLALSWFLAWALLSDANTGRGSTSSDQRSGRPDRSRPGAPLIRATFVDRGTPGATLARTSPPKARADPRAYQGSVVGASSTPGTTPALVFPK